MNLKFEWDPTKASTNKTKHQVSFEYATRVFLDPHRRDGEDTRYDYKEERRIVLGFIEARLFVVAYTERDGVIRLITARKANPREQKSHANAVQP